MRAQDFVDQQSSGSVYHKRNLDCEWGLVNQSLGVFGEGHVVLVAQEISEVLFGLG